MRIFFDTNVLASALVGHGLCRDLLDRALIGHTVLLGEPVREELHRVLTTKFRVPADLWHELDKKLREFEQAPSTSAPLGESLADADDVPIVACAITAKADVFVTGDKELLNLGTIKGMPILPPRELWQKLTGVANQ